MDSKRLHVKRAEEDRIGAAQIRAARALLGWSRNEAAEHCRVGINTISRLENGERVPGPRTMSDIVRVFNDAGVVFVDGMGGAGVLLGAKTD